MRGYALTMDRSPSPVRDASHRVHPLPQGERGRTPNLLTPFHDRTGSRVDNNQKFRRASRFLPRGVGGVSAAAGADRLAARLFIRPAARAVGLDAVGMDA